MASHNIFLIYSSADKDLVTRICDDLRANGLTVYVDDGSASGTPTLNRVINDRMRSANVLISLLSPEARASDTLVQKLAFAASLKKPLYLILARGDESTAIPPGFSTHTLIDIRRDYNRISTELIPKLFNALDIQDAVKVAPKLKPVTAVEKPVESPEPQPSSAERQEAPYDFSKPLKHPRRTKRKNRTRDLALLFLFLISFYFLWRNLGPGIGQFQQLETRQAEIAQTLTNIGGQIAFTSDRDDNPELYVMNVDGSNLVKLTDNGSALDGIASWSPDSRLITFTSNLDGDVEVYVMNADGSNLANLTNNTVGDTGSNWSPDGTRIVFLSVRDGDSEIYVMNADGSNPVNLTNNNVDDAAPTWSPDGSRIAFNSNRDGNFEIYVMNADGSNPFRLTSNEFDDGNPSWSPDGLHISFTTLHDSNSEIYVMNVDGSNPVNLTNHEATDRFPAWSPDGRHIAFATNRDGNSEIYIMNPDGSNPINLTNNPADDSVPSWRP